MMMYVYRREKRRNLLKENKINEGFILSLSQTRINIIDKRKLNKSNFEKGETNI